MMRPSGYEKEIASIRGFESLRALIFFRPMLKKSISSLELAALVHELQVLAGSKISQIYQREQELLLELHLRGAGKQFLKIIPGKWLCLTKVKNVPLTPSNFCMQLRKYLGGAILTSVQQKNSERIVVMKVENKEPYSIVVELFSKGNFILTDKNEVIIAVLERQEWKDRVIEPGKKYIFPVLPAVDWKTLSERELEVLLQASGKRNLVTSLATDIGLGGVYAEELCRRSGLDKNVLPTTISKSDSAKLKAALTMFLQEIKMPQGFLYPEQVTPIPLQGEVLLGQTSTYNEAIDALNPFQLESPYEKKIAGLNRIIAGQEEAVKEMESKITENARKGELIYEKYAPLHKLLSIVQELRKSHSWSEVAVELNKEKKIKKVDLEHKKVVIDL